MNESHNKAAEMHNLAAHAHRVAAAHHASQDHLSGRERSNQALEHSNRAWLQAQEPHQHGQQVAAGTAESVPGVKDSRAESVTKR